METLETLGRRIATTQDLQSIVRTMKSLSAVSIRQYEQAAVVLREHKRTIELGLQIVLREGGLPDMGPQRDDSAAIAIVFGSEHGLCGRFNRDVADLARQDLHRRRGARGDDLFLAAGARAAAQLEAAGERVEAFFSLPGSADGLTETARSLLLKVDELRAEREIGRVLLFHNMRAEHDMSAPVRIQLLPLDARWLRRLSERHWQSRAIPTHTMDAETLFAALVRQHLFVELFHAAAESAASEHATRLAAMKAAERNIKDHLEEMNTAYRGKRQASITDELLDVVAGFEALANAD